MDFDRPKVYGDTSITDGLVFATYNICSVKNNLTKEDEKELERIFANKVTKKEIIHIPM